MFFTYRSISTWNNVTLTQNAGGIVCLTSTIDFGNCSIYNNKNQIDFASCSGCSLSGQITSCNCDARDVCSVCNGDNSTCSSGCDNSN